MKRPKAPKKTAQEIQLEVRQRSELFELDREENERLKSIKRRRRGRRTLLGSGSELGIRPGLGSAGQRTGGAGTGGGAAGGSGPTGGGGGARGGGSGSILGSGGRASVGRR